MDEQITYGAGVTRTAPGGEHRALSNNYEWNAMDSITSDEATHKTSDLALVLSIVAITVFVVIIFLLILSWCKGDQGDKSYSFRKPWQILVCDESRGVWRNVSDVTVKLASKLRSRWRSDQIYDVTAQPLNGLNGEPLKIEQSIV